MTKTDEVDDFTDVYVYVHVYVYVDGKLTLPYTYT